jgi:hypothetical protein
MPTPLFSSDNGQIHAGHVIFLAQHLRRARLPMPGEPGRVAEIG